MNKQSPHRLMPKLFQSLQGYRRQDIFPDLIAGLTVGLGALPLAMAFAISSGVKPESGIYTAIVAGFLVSALGGSRCQIAGPTGAFVVIVAGIVTTFGVAGLLMCTMMAGVILVVLAFTGLGGAVRFIPRPVTIGFTNGIAILIASTQIKDFLGLTVEHVPSEFAERIWALLQYLGTINITATAMAVASLVLILAWPRLTTRVPGSIVALLAVTIASATLGLDAETIGSRFGGIPSGLPDIGIPEFRPELILPLIPSAVTVALLAAIESLLSAVVADNMSGDRHRPNAELLAQGVANVLVPMVGGHSRHGGDCSNRYEHPRRGSLTHCRHCPCPDTTWNLARRGAPGTLYSPGDLGRRSPRRGLQHERMARDRRHSPFFEGGSRRLAVPPLV